MREGEEGKGRGGVEGNERGMGNTIFFQACEGGFLVLFFPSDFGLRILP